MAKYNILNDKVNTYFTKNKMVSASAKPNSGTWATGDIVISNSVSDGIFGWLCKQGGTPGTWIDLKSAADLTGEVTNHTHDSRYMRQKIGNVTDFNNCKTAGTYAVNSSSNIANAPYTGAIYGSLLILPSTGNELNQVFTDNRGQMFNRFLQNNGSWTAWSKNYTTNSKPSWNDIANKPGTFTPAAHTHEEYFNKKTGGIIAGPTIINNDLSLERGFVISDRSDGTKGFHMNTYQTKDGTNKTYIELVLKDPSGNGDWHWGKSLKLFEDGVVGLNSISMNGHMRMSNQSSIRGYNRNGDRDYHLIGVDEGNNIAVGWGNETYINMNNTMRCFHDIHMQTATTIYVQGMKVCSGDGLSYSSFSIGPSHVRFEYAHPNVNGGEGCVYVAGSESESSGFGTPFAAKYLESKENYIKIGGRKLFMQDGDPGGAAGGHSIWIKTN